MRKLLRWFAFLSALAVFGAFLFVPVYEYETAMATANGVESRARGRGTLVEGSGSSALVIVAVPLLVAGAALLKWPSRARRAADVIAAAIVMLFCVLGALSVGLFFLPTALALLLVALWPGQRTTG